MLSDTRLDGGENAGNPKMNHKSSLQLMLKLSSTNSAMNIDH